MIRGRDSQIGELDTFDARDSDVEPPKEVSHYVPYFSVEKSTHGTRSGRPMRRLRAVCGEWVDYPAEHSTEPTCSECEAYLESDPYAEKSGEDVF